MEEKHKIGKFLMVMKSSKNKNKDKELPFSVGFNPEQPALSLPILGEFLFQDS